MFMHTGLTLHGIFPPCVLDLDHEFEVFEQACSALHLEVTW